MYPDTLQLAVESPAGDLRVILVAGELDRTTSERLARLIDQQTHAVSTDGSRRGNVVIDLGNVRYFGVGGLEVLLSARDSSCDVGVGVHLAGLGARELLLPRQVIDQLGGFSTFDTLEQALRRLR